jgi:hypothetical protein
MVWLHGSSTSHRIRWCRLPPHRPDWSSDFSTGLGEAWRTIRLSLCLVVRRAGTTARFDMAQHPAPFDPETSCKLLRLADDLPAIWDEMRGHEVHLFDLVVSHIEQMRARPPDELPYTGYFQEVLREQLGSYYSASWMLKNRKTWSGALYRSAYLDRLQTKKDAGEYAFLSDQPGMANMIDANEALYVSLKLTDTPRWMRFIQECKAQKQTEAQRFEARIRALSDAPCKPTPSRMARLLDDVLTTMGFESVLRDVKQARFIYRRSLDARVALYVEYDDHRPGHGGWPVFVFHPSDAPLWERLDKRARTAALVLSIVDFLPGGRWYLRAENDWDTLVLGYLVNAQLLRLLTERWTVTAKLA